MAHPEHAPRAPDWDHLYKVAEGQAGYFTTRQAAEAGYSPQLLVYLSGKKVSRVRRGIYRLIHFSASDHEELVMLWLWSKRAGVFSHETALALHDLSDVLPGKVHMTLPRAWQRRRLRVPEGLVLHFANVEEAERGHFGAVPVTVPLRTLRDCLAMDLAPGLIDQAIFQARHRGLITAAEAAGLRGARSGQAGFSPKTALPSCHRKAGNLDCRLGLRH
ncbi:MAG: type IV toxin-antitoxin system AbiEi family antitoxin domain-containing protein [Thermoanaerobaculia bacterium]|nr:type IV toxin-antitoxin system AbiEi family antitoxin domain-containing protein [Thermoanaerobaculia bacterium]